MNSRRVYRQRLAEIRTHTAEAINLADCQLTRTSDALLYRDLELAQIVIDSDGAIDDSYTWIHTTVLGLLARESPIAGDLRLLTSSLTISRCIERIGDQCANAAKLVPISAEAAPTDQTTLRLLERMASCSHRQLSQIYESLSTETPLDTERLTREQTQVNRLDREVLLWCIEIGTDPAIREWAMLMVLAARCIQRISQNTVEIVRQLNFIATGTMLPRGLDD